MFAFPPFEISPKYAFIRQILHYLDGSSNDKYETILNMKSL